MNEQRLRKSVPQAAMPSAGSGFLLSLTLDNAFRFQEGFGGETRRLAPRSLPVPPAPHPPRQSSTPAQVGTSSAPGEGERKCEGVFPRKSGKSRSDFRGSHSLRPALAAEPSLTAVPNPAPAPCRTQGVRGAADTPPASHRPATTTSARSFHGPKREGFGGEKAALCVASLPVPPAPHPPRQSNTPAQAGTSSAPGEGERKCEGVFPQKSGKSRSDFRGSLSHRPAPDLEPGLTAELTRHRHPAGRRGCGGRRTRHPLPTGPPPPPADTGFLPLSNSS